MSKEQKEEPRIVSCPSEVLTLVDRFNQNLESYRSGKYNETQLRQEFLNPLFEALGWDMTNRAGYAEAYKEVIHEDTIKIGQETKAPDYCFRIGGTRKFFLEAKKPSVYIKEEVPPAFQLRRYAWSAKPQAEAIRRLAYRTDRSYETYRTSIEKEDAGVAANTLVCLIHQTNYLLDQQLRQLEERFLKEGGFTERLYQKRRESRK